MIEILSVLVVVLVVAVIIYFIVKNCKGTNDSSKDTKDNYGDVVSHRYFQLQKNENDLKATYGGQNSENLKVAKLDQVISMIRPGEKIGVMSINNNIGNRRGLESEEPVRQNLCPYVEIALNKRGLKLARNTDDGKVVLKEHSGDYDYPIGYFMFVVPK